MGRPATAPNRRQVGLDDELWERVTNYRFNRRLDSESPLSASWSSWAWRWPSENRPQPRSRRPHEDLVESRAARGHGRITDAGICGPAFYQLEPVAADGRVTAAF